MAFRIHGSSTMIFRGIRHRTLELYSFQNRLIFSARKYAQNHKISQTPPTNIHGRKTTLKYDPSNTTGDFTSFGVIPFIQHRLNQLYLPASNSGGAPSSNIRPNDDQRKILATLGSEHSLVLKGGARTGKSLALCTYSLNLVLSRVPKYGVLQKRSSVDSIIVVPTDQVVDQYKDYFAKLTQGIPPDCCPDSLTLDSGSSSYSLSRKPLVIEYLRSNGDHEVSSSNVSESIPKGVPQILVTTLSGLVNILNDEGNQITRQKHLLDLRLFSVDEMNFFLNSTYINEEPLIAQTGKKSKYFNKLEQSIKTLQNQHLLSFKKDLEYRLKKTTEKFTQEQKQEGKETSTDTSDDLKQRLIKHTRKVLYKPIQFCFINTRETTFKHLIQTKQNLDNIRNINQTLQSQLNSRSAGSELDEKINGLYSKYLIEKSDQLLERDEDPLTKFLEKIVRFNDEQRQIKDRERKLVTAVGTGNNTDFTSIDSSEDNDNLPQSTNTSRINAFFSIGMSDKSAQLQIKDLNIKKNFPDNSRLIELINKHVHLSKNNIKNLEKSYLKYKMSFLHDTDADKNVRKYISTVIAQFQNRNPEVASSPFMVVVPSYVNINKIIKKLKSTMKNEEFISIKYVMQDNAISQPKHLIIHPLDLLGSKISGYSNMLVLGIESLLPQLAFVPKDKLLIKEMKDSPSPEKLTRNKLIDEISGISDPYNDLVSFYLSRLETIPGTKQNEEKNIIFTLDSHSPKISKQINNKFEQDSKRFSQILMYNNILDEVNLKKLVRSEVALEYGLDENFLSVISSRIAAMK